MPNIQKPVELEQEAAPLLRWAQSLAISTPADLESAADGLKRIKALTKRFIDYFKPMKQAADQTKRSILDAERQALDPLEAAECAAKRAILTYQQEQERIRLAEQRRLQAEADEKARREREAAEKKAAAAKRPETRAKYEEQAAAVIAPVVNLAPMAPKVDGIASRKIWKCRVVEPSMLPREYMIPDMPTLNALAKALKERAKVPGVEFYSEDVLAASAQF